MHTNIQTIIAVLIFAVGYLLYIARATAHNKLDIYDLIILSTVAIVPTVFVLFPAVAVYLAQVLGVMFPFVIMFGALFAILFIFVYRLTTKIHLLEHDNRLLIQEVSLLKAKQIKLSP
ncbi:MAG: DUF2304 domain-containing protein [Bdellovibrionaceae bacterium]|nr:DUF2304 domain-containing protein [Pseudobdellovibrionaceae bacterium]